jgi:hypothetical protein
VVDAWGTAILSPKPSASVQTDHRSRLEAVLEGSGTKPRAAILDDPGNWSRASDAFAARFTDQVASPPSLVATETQT